MALLQLGETLTVFLDILVDGDPVSQEPWLGFQALPLTCFMP